MNFENIEFLGKGTSRNSQAGGTKDVNYHFALVTYTKQTKEGPVEVDNFSFSGTAMRAFGLESPEIGCNVVTVEGNKLIAIVPNDKAVFLGAAKRGANKSKAVSVPTLKEALIEKGIAGVFEGRQYFNMVKVGEHNGIIFLDVVPADVAPKAYVPENEANENEANATEVPNAPSAEEANY